MNDSRLDTVLVVPGELIVRFAAGTDSDQRSSARREAGTRLAERLPVADIELLRLDPGVSLAEATARLESEAGVLYAEPNFYRSAARTPNDPFFGYLWALHNTGQSLFGVTGSPDADIDAPNAWDVSTGSSAINVAIIDSGLDLDHRDLAPNVWKNAGESGGGRETNRLDDDLNGLVDDFRGWDWIGSDNEPRDGNGHGTHVAGTIGARGDDGFGIAGVAWNARLMALRVLDNQGTGTVGSVLQAYSYAFLKGARIVNASFGGDHPSRSEHDVMRALPNVLFVVAAGNEGADNDQRPGYPCSYDLGNVVCVAASNEHDSLAPFSNYGATSVDLAAPGTNIASSWPGGGHVVLNGTSMAAPHVAGAAALLFSKSQTLSVPAARTSILQSVDHKAALATIVATGGRLNASRALGLEPPPEGPRTPSGSAPTSGRDTTPPRVSLRVRRRERLRRALRRGVRARVRCSEPCRLEFRLLIGGRSTRSLGLLRVRRQILVGNRIAVGGSKRRTVVIRVRASARRRLARAKRARLVVAVKATDEAGNVARTQQGLTVRR